MRAVRLLLTLSIVVLFVAGQDSEANEISRKHAEERRKREEKEKYDIFLEEIKQLPEEEREQRLQQFHKDKEADRKARMDE